ncbi:MAG: hypothetical protein NVS4B2_22890 [Chloroflexota bacterium]
MSGNAMNDINGSRITVIEDEPEIAELLCDVLGAEGSHIVSLSHPAAAEGIDLEQPPDLILMDLMLPEMDGIKLAGWLRHNGFAHTPMVAMSASRIMLHFAGESNLFQDVVAKPFDIDRLIECVRRYVGMYVS